MEREYDLIAVGAGSGGLGVALRAAALGARVAIVEPGRLGGTCVNLGCIPKKVMWCAAAIARALAEAPRWGFDVDVRGHDWARLKAQRDTYVERLNASYAQRLERRGVEHHVATARFEGEGVLRAGEQLLRAPHIVIATGGHPRPPDVPGAHLGITSDGFFALETCPRRVAIVGAGYVAAELAAILHALGAKVSVYARGDRLLRDFDAMLGLTLAEAMAAEGIEITTGAEVRAVEQRGALLTLRLADGREVDGYDCLLWATGRVPNTESLALSRAGVALDESGHVVIDDFQRTNVRGIYAVGDVTDRPQLTPVAIAAGRRLAERLLSGSPDRTLDRECIPTVVFSQPPIGSCGLSEADARARHGEDAVHVYAERFTPLVHQISGRTTPVAMKLVTVGAEERVVGCHLIGPGADEILQGFAVVMRMGVTKRQLEDTVAIHPTVAEELLTLR